MNLTKLKTIFAKNGCQKIYVKHLSANDNSKNQVYFGGSFEILSMFPIEDIQAVPAGDWKKERFKAKLNFSWITEEGTLSHAPASQFILYPKYPEVRFSGFLLSSRHAPSELMTQRLPNRILFLGSTSKNSVVGFVAPPESEIANEFLALKNLEEFSVFKVIKLPILQNNRTKLIEELLRIHSLGWIRAKRLNRFGEILNCDSPNCGGYTLEAELNITPNGYSAPDYLGWEIKQFGVTNFDKVESKIVTLLTPEPTSGIYKTEGAEFFVRTYGYKDTSGKANRMNFGGIHKAGIIQPLTNLRLELIGYDPEKETISPDGKIALLDVTGQEAASWSFSSLLLHWNRKHNQACYVPSLSDRDGIGRLYRYGNKVALGSNTDFRLFLKELALGNIYYDPGIKLEDLDCVPKLKKRSQFRIKSGNLKNLYFKNEIVDVLI